jgi:hypothetical protein
MLKVCALRNAYHRRTLRRPVSSFVAVSTFVSDVVK